MVDLEWLRDRPRGDGIDIDPGEDPYNFGEALFALGVPLEPGASLMANTDEKASEALSMQDDPTNLTGMSITGPDHDPPISIPAVQTIESPATHPTTTTATDDDAYPQIYDCIHLSNIPDYTGGVLSTFLYATPMIYPGHAHYVTSTCLRNPPRFPSFASYNNDYLGMNTQSDVAKTLKVRMAPPEDRPQPMPMNDYLNWHTLPGPSKLANLMPREKLETWLYRLFLKRAIPVHKDEIQDFTLIYSPLNLTAFPRVVCRLHDNGYPAHWLSEVVDHLLQGKIKTSARPPRSEPLSLQETNVEMSVIVQSATPFVAEFSTLVSIWQFALPFGLTSSAFPSIDMVRQYRVDFEEVLDVVGNTPVFVVGFCETRLVPPQIWLRPFLLSDEKQEGSPQAKRIREEGLHIVSTWQWSRSTKSATFWLRRDLVERLKRGPWMVGIWRTDNSRQQARPEHVIEVKDPTAQPRDFVKQKLSESGDPHNAIALTPGSAMGEEKLTDRKRLHITPFTPTLLDRFIPPSLASSASGISFHTIETFPERGFGYVELPAMEAEKLKKKLNGMTLKGAKVHIEDAKPEKKQKRKAEVEMETEEERKVRKKAKKVEKRKREEGVLVGHELDEGRRVKRGWTGDGSERKREKKGKKVKGVDGDFGGKKARFRTSVPLNKAPVDVKANGTGQDKKEKKEESARRKMVVVQEFAKAEKPSSTEGMSTKGTAAVRYEDSQGWVDEHGNVVEVPVKSKRPKKKSLPDPTPATTQLLSSSTAKMSSGVAESDSDEAVSSVVSSDPPTEDEAESEPGHGLTERVDVRKEKVSALNDPSTPPEHTPLRDAPKLATEVHPLEALFKRPAPKPESASKPKPSPIDTSFSFFTPGPTDDAEDEVAAYPPQTPHTKEDLEWRSIRSAAPTPDTAAIGKRFEFSLARDVDEDEDGESDESMGRDDDEVQEDVQMEGDASTALNGAVSDGKEESAFRKWFYDHRGDLNRSWKKRRRDERKQKRQRENKRLGRRVA
ncbi:hypothetical protein B0A55_09868 [Friedmanniomyces simplex]|uniref:RRM domain-containing protein n=1 Tax=Friedmanniomyces simplex TaxID=329884 RepID=A0A4U0WS50_9PEZI|nr:hypothetical protein B0A55_09868 [Friedmanniomyces simplex]